MIGIQVWEARVGSWTDILNELQQRTRFHEQKAASVLDDVRRENLKKLFEYTKRNTIAYYSAFLSKPRIQGAEIVDDDKNALMNCIHNLDRKRGLDLILHTPGGDVAAAESIINYLREMFGNNIRALVPQIAMSSGTMIACSCKSIVMGKQSSIGPIDPQLSGIPADVVVSEFKRAYEEISEDAKKAQVWAPILSRYPPSFVTQCEYAVQWAKNLVEDALKRNMFAEDKDDSRAKEVTESLSSSELNKTHSKHLHYNDCRNIGLNVEMLEDDQQLQDLLLTVHHSYIHTTSNSTCLKIVENHDGRAMVRHAPPASAPQNPSVGFGGPS